MALVSNRYGKGRVRVMRVKRDTPRHEVRELDVSAILEGDFAATYTAADNAKTVSTDTVKNVINVVAHGHLDLPTELFGKAVCDRFLHDYAQVEKVTVTARETKWSRLKVDGAEHDHAFLLDGNGKPFAKVTATRSSHATVSGVEGFTFLKTTESGWSDYFMDPLTTIKETTDRICSTSMIASWDWTGVPADYVKANAVILDTMMKVFATTYSKERAGQPLPNGHGGSRGRAGDRDGQRGGAEQALHPDEPNALRSRL